MTFKGIIAAIVAFFQTLFINWGIMKINNYSVDISPINVLFSQVNAGNSQESNLISSAEYAASLKNQVQRTYTSSNRNGFIIANKDITIKGDLSGFERYTSISDKNGNDYIASSFKSYFVDSKGNKRYFENSDYEKGRVNDIRIGLYYYDTHIRDFKIKTLDNIFGVDKGFHVFGDKLYMEYSLLAQKATDNVAEFGSEIAIPVNTVNSFEIKDSSSVHNTLDNIDFTNVEYAAFDIKDVGIISFITAYDDMAKSLNVKIENDNYIITQTADYEISEGLNAIDETGNFKNNKITLGARIYTDSTHSFDGARLAYSEEKNPLEITVTEQNTNGKALGYNHFRGTYEVYSDFLGFNEAYYNHPDYKSSVKVNITGANADRKIYFDCTSKVACLESAVLLDENKVLAPIDMEVCKNFQGDGGEDFYSQKDHGYSDAICPMIIKADKTTTFYSLLVMQRWGKMPIKQLSSIEFHIAYYHLSTGVTESNCIAPYFVFDRDGWTLPDFRGASGEMWPSQPQFNSVGILKFMQYRDKKVKETVLSEFTGSEINSVGLTYADVTNHYTADSGKYTYTLRHVEMPQTDENRTYYSLKVDFTDTVKFSNFKKNFDLFYFDGRFVSFDNINYLDENNNDIIKPVSKKTTYHKLGSQNPYIGYLKINEDTYDETVPAGANFALLIKDSSIVMSGQEKNIPFVFRECTTKSNGSEGVLTLDTEKITFNKGDSIEIDLILLPYGTGFENDNSNALSVREDSIIKPSSVTASVGTVVDDSYLNRVKCSNNNAVFTVTGGRNNNTVRIDGFTGCGKPTIKEFVDSQWVDYIVSSSDGFDGYQVQLNNDGTYSYSFNYFMDSPDSERTFSITVN